MHMLDASLRMVDGELPHQDFMTPIGILGFAPVAAFLALGFGVGKATLLANMAVAALLLPATWWVGATRLTMAQAIVFGIGMVALLAAVVFGGGSTAISLSMFYNRWAWGVTFLVLATVLFPKKVALAEHLIAPLVIGLGMAILAMLKMTFFVPLAPVVILILFAQKRAGLAGWALLVGAMVGAILVGFLGVDFFKAYLGDLLAVTQSNSGRTSAGESFSAVVANPHTIVGSLVLLGSLLVFRKSGRMEQGLVILLLAPVFAYITYQNWGNDPKWLFIVILYLWINLPDKGELAAFRLPARQSVLALLCVATTLAIPSAISLVTSPFRAAFASTQGYELLPIRGEVSDIWLPEARVQNVVVRTGFEGMPALLPEHELLEINGFTFQDCRLTETIVPMNLAMAKQVAALDFTKGQPVLTADVLNVSWLLADITRVKGAAPWYYGDDAGLENTAYLMVPLCPIKTLLRDEMVAQFMDAGYGLNEVYSSSLMRLYEVAKP